MSEHAEVLQASDTDRNLVYLAIDGHCACDFFRVANGYEMIPYQKAREHADRIAALLNASTGGPLEAAKSAAREFAEQLPESVLGETSISELAVIISTYIEAAICGERSEIIKDLRDARKTKNQNDPMYRDGILDGISDSIAVVRKRSASSNAP